MVAYCLQKVSFRMELDFRNVGFKEGEKVFRPKTYQKSLIRCLINSASIS